MRRLFHSGENLLNSSQIFDREEPNHVDVNFQDADRSNPDFEKKIVTLLVLGGVGAIILLAIKLVKLWKRNIGNASHLVIK